MHSFPWDKNNPNLRSDTEAPHCALHWCTAPMHCTDILTYKTYQTQTKIRTNCHGNRQNTDASPETNYNPTVAMAQLRFSQLYWKLQTDRLTNHRDTRPRTDTEWTSWKQFPSLSWPTDHRSIEQNLCTELSIQKKEKSLVLPLYLHNIIT